MVMNKFFGSKKIKISDMDGSKLDSAIISSPKDMDSVMKRWKKKGLI